MAKITISQLQTAEAVSIQELTNSELDATKGGITIVIAPVINLADTAILGQANTSRSTNTGLANIGQNLVGAIL
ncbi:hypothetical protein WA1_43065 [Scytonema hofmannii PCC 7110]|uniref:Bacteriocin n=1 Tax=Scytonema hofmannii PCC 7110 TaxID=128403 RepID=A0A139WVN9_9CYAN|nr:hypothetical protein [Scytonema hofmannii]KYC36481.1 hypothetical protein WA1_43065 [Scytonema hofmannii PCC 7110]